MSIENAILELAAALNNVAESNHAIAAASLKTEESYRASISAYAGAVAGGSALVTTGVADSAELEKAVTKVETDAKADAKPSTAKVAIADALAAAKKEKESATATQNAQSQGDGQDSDNPLDAAPLDWDKDVRPALLAVGKDRDALVKLMAKYEVPKGGKAPAEKWAALLAEANAIVAARG